MLHSLHVDSIFSHFVSRFTWGQAGQSRFSHFSGAAGLPGQWLSLRDREIEIVLRKGFYTRRHGLQMA